MRERRGVARLECLFDGYMAWLAGTVIDGGCVFMTLSQEYRNRPGVIRDTVVQAFKAQGWVWGGDWGFPGQPHSIYDKMHFQAAKVR